VERTSFISTARSLYLISLTLMHCNTARDLIEGSMNFFTWPGIMLETYEIFFSHTWSFSACRLTMSCKSVKSSGGPNYGKSISLISWLIFSQLFSHSSHLSCIFCRGSWTMCTQYSASFHIRAMLLSINTRMPCSYVSRPFCTSLM
jgi:hypothetical protein